MKKALKQIPDMNSFDSLGVGVVVIDADTHRILHINTEMQNISMFESEEIVGKNLVDIFSKKSQIRVQGLLNLETIDSDMIISESNAVLRKRSGSALHVSLYVKRLVHSNQKLVTVINSEPRRELEIELEQVYAQMIQTSKFMSLAEMAAGIAHEINNPLAIIHSYAEQMKILAEKDKLTKEKANQLGGKITAAAMRASRIINSLKKLSRNEPEEGLSVGSLNEIIKEALDFYSERFSSYGIELIHKPMDSEIQVYCNSSQILQVLLNLLENALHATKSQDERWIEVAVTRADFTVKVSVNDSGPGVPEDLLTDIMNPFFTTKEVGEGTGLGLSISRAIIEKHDGELFYDSGKKGASFNFVLPLVDDLTKASLEALDLELDLDDHSHTSLTHDRVPFNPSDYKILIVDDEVDLAESVEFGIESKGYQVLVAHDGEAAFDLMKQHRVDVVLTDIRMPKMNGFELLSQVKQQLDYFPKIFFVTGSSNIPMDQYFDEGAEGFFYKPVSIFKLLQTLKESLLPPEKLLERQRLRFHFDKKFEVQVNPRKDPHVGNLGRGGMFIEEGGELPRVGDAIEFTLNIKHHENSIQVKGSAMVRWVRGSATADRKRGFGVEFYRFEKEGAQELFDCLSTLQTQAFIPVGS
jgi:PAS domain S-box-containing protein